MKSIKNKAKFRRAMTDEKEKEKSKERDMDKEYESVKKKYSLPELKELDREFCIGKLEDTTFFLRSILLKMIERLENVFKLLSDIVQPSESQLATMYEAEVFSDDEKKVIFDMMKKMAYFHRELALKDLNYDDDSAANAINKFYKDWLGMKKEVTKIMEKLRDAWKGEAPPKFEAGYFG
jgi:hypothetical protein